MELVIDNCNNDEVNKHDRTVIREGNLKYYANFSAFLCQHAVIYGTPITVILVFLCYPLGCVIKRASGNLIIILTIILLVLLIIAMFVFIAVGIRFYYKSYLKPAIEIFPEIGIYFGDSIPRLTYNEAYGYNHANPFPKLKSGILTWKKIEKFELLHASKMPKSNFSFGRNSMCIVVYTNLKCECLRVQPFFVHFASFKNADGNEIFENMVKYHSNWIKQQSTSERVSQDEDANIPVSINDENGIPLKEMEIIPPSDDDSLFTKRKAWCCISQ